MRGINALGGECGHPTPITLCETCSPATRREMEYLRGVKYWGYPSKEHKMKALTLMDSGAEIPDVPKY